ncbi:serine hydrolase domain-containing protein [Pseudodonghicola flavimaris]|uniref:Serine hydrolase n=1 Tax=Pseudodonghicola flavimaris TaxID=3050036 RepID=A0ABT7F4Z0_9RHOB|nr:serine hydrolase [Pseudodonghicola flavimaris]MDK3019681.1 serine hydrolase [Pseudodonghicola flavimaris]
MRSYRNSDPRPPIMQGHPVPPEWRVPPHDWDSPPWNRWAFQHMREMVPTVEVRRGETVWPLPGTPGDIAGIPYDTLDGRRSDWGAMLEETYTDAALIWLDGRVIAETYCNGMDSRRPHIAFSVSKSVVGAVAGSLIAEGQLDPAAPVTDYVPELAATAWAGATLQQVLDMTSGTTFDESYGNQDAHVFLLDVAANIKPIYPFMDPDRVPGCIWELILSLTEAEAPHGSRFEYRSIETDLLGALMERVSGQRLADLVSDRLWAPMGAAEDGFFTVDRAGFAMADGGFNATLRDFARFGRLLLEDGARDGRQILPRTWIEDIRAGDHGLFNAQGRDMLPRGRYRNQFWIEDDSRPAHLSLGIFGQHIYVDPEIGLVAVKLSSWPDFLSAEGHMQNWLRAVKAVAAAYGAPA